MKKALFVILMLSLCLAGFASMPVIDPNNVRVPASCPPPYLDPDQMINPGGLSCVVAVSAEIQDVGVLVFPNPSKDGFNIQCEGLTNIEVFSMDGKMIMSIAPTGTQCFINGLNSGMYLLRIVSSQGLTFRKIVKF